MKKFLRVLSVVLVFALVVSALGISAFAKDGKVKQKLRDATSAGIEFVLKGALSGVSKLLPDGDNFFDAVSYRGTGFINGTGDYHSPLPDARWNLGAAAISLVPADYREKDYYLGGYIMPENGFNNKVEGVIDDMKARAIAISDGTGRGVAVFATIDCIGITNKDIRKIRQRLIEKAGDDLDFSGITVTSTHAHSGIDTEGLWTNILSKMPKNFFKSLLRIGNLETGTDSDYMSFLYEKVSDAMLAACKDMEPGTLSFASKDIGADYFVNKNRSSASTLITNLNRFIFTPDNASSAPTMIVNIAAHPDVAGLPTSDGQGNGRQVCGEYIYYAGEIINKAGYDFMFFNGAIAGVYMARGASNDGQEFTARYQQSQRYGYELGKMALAMTMTESEIDNSTFLADKETVARESALAGNGYTLWYKGWTSVEESAVAPCLNLRFKEVRVQVTNPLIQIAGKLNLAAYDVLTEGKKYYLQTEVGFMQLGDIKIALMPGEVCQDLVAGGSSLTAEGSYSGTAFSGKTVEDIFGKGTIVFGLANDAIGYIVPDNDYCMCIAFDHYHELISVGSTAASSIMAGLDALSNEFLVK